MACFNKKRVVFVVVLVVLVDAIENCMNAGNKNQALWSLQIAQC